MQPKIKPVKRGHRGIVDNVLDSDTVESEFELQSRCYVYFWTNILGINYNLGFKHNKPGPVSWGC